MFEQWKEQELAQIKEQYGKARIITLAVVVLMALNLPMELGMLLDGGGGFGAVSLAVTLGIMALAWRLGDYKSRFVKPLLAAVEESLPTQGERERFAQQMGAATQIPYSPAPQTKPGLMLLGEDYCYFRQPRRVRILKNRELRRAELTRGTYTVGRGHIRICYDLSLFGEEEKPLWRASYPAEEEAYQTLELLRGKLPANLRVEDGIAYGKTEEGRKKARRSEGLQILLCIAIVVVLVIIAKVL